MRRRAERRRLPLKFRLCSFIAVFCRSRLGHAAFDRHKVRSEIQKCHLSPETKCYLSLRFVPVRLACTRFFWLQADVPEEHLATFADLLEMNLKTSRAWLYKEQMVEFWHQENAAAGDRFFMEWYRTVMRSQL